MPNIIRIRNLEIEQNLEGAIIPIDNLGYTGNAKRVEIEKLKDWILADSNKDSNCDVSSSNSIKIVHLYEKLLAYSTNSNDVCNSQDIQIYLVDNEDFLNATMIRFDSGITIKPGYYCNGLCYKYLDTYGRFSATTPGVCENGVLLVITTTTTTRPPTTTTTTRPPTTTTTTTIDTCTLSGTFTEIIIPTTTTTTRPPTTTTTTRPPTTTTTTKAPTTTTTTRPPTTTTTTIPPTTTTTTKAPTTTTTTRPPTTTTTTTTSDTCTLSGTFTEVVSLTTTTTTSPTTTTTTTTTKPTTTTTTTKPTTTTTTTQPITTTTTTKPTTTTTTTKPTTTTTTTQPITTTTTTKIYCFTSLIKCSTANEIFQTTGLTSGSVYCDASGAYNGTRVVDNNGNYYWCLIQYSGGVKAWDHDMIDVTIVSGQYGCPPQTTTTTTQPTTTTTTTQISTFYDYMGTTVQLSPSEACFKDSALEHYYSNNEIDIVNGSVNPNTYLYTNTLLTIKVQQGYYSLRQLDYSIVVSVDNNGLVSFEYSCIY